MTGVIVLSLLLAPMLPAVPAAAQTCGLRQVDCPFAEGFVPCAPTCVTPGGTLCDCEAANCAPSTCPASHYDLTGADAPCPPGNCPPGLAKNLGPPCRCMQAAPPCPARACPAGDPECCSPVAGECCEDRPRNAQGQPLYSTKRCWPFADADGNSRLDAGDEPIALTALWGACQNNIDNRKALGRLAGVYVTRGETKPGELVSWSCTSVWGPPCPYAVCHEIALTSPASPNPVSLTTPANAPNGQQFFGSQNHIAFKVTLEGGDFINQSCSAWKDHASDHSLEVRARNVLLGGTMVGTHIVYDLRSGDALSFEATDNCVIGGNYVGIDTARVGPIPAAELDCSVDDSEVRKHGSFDLPCVTLRAPAGAGLVDLSRQFTTANPSLWTLDAQDGGVLVEACTVNGVETSQMNAACRMIRRCGDDDEELPPGCSASYCTTTTTTTSLP